MLHIADLLEQTRRLLLMGKQSDAHALLARSLRESIDANAIQLSTNINDTLSAQPRNLELLHMLGTALTEQELLPPANECWEKILAINPHDSVALLRLVTGRRKCCDWRDFDALAACIQQQTEANLQRGQPPVETVLLSLSTSTDRAYQYRLSKAWATNRAQRYRPQYSHDRATLESTLSPRITLGYISNEFRDHPVGHLMRNYFKYHDRERFRVIVYFDHPPDDRDPVYRDIHSTCEETRAVAGMDHQALAELIHHDRVEILLDLKGWREQNRLAVFALRPAPLAVAFQGFPGTTGATYIDYIVADDYVVPPSDAGCYAEKLAYLGRCYQVNSDSLPPYERLRAMAGTRNEHCLPEDAVVLASFNQAYKLDPHMTGVWMEVMRRVENTVLWLLELNDACRTNLRQFAADHGVAPQRLIFAPWADHDRHLARLTHADIALDTQIYNGHATTSDALWSRVPVVALAGQHFASRVSASILREVDFAQLVVHNLSDYRSLVLRLIEDTPLRESLRAHLTIEHLHATLFNTRDYVRRMENLFEQMINLHRRGQPPQMLQTQPPS
jgi:protein O-GlcNAc transferase